MTDLSILVPSRNEMFLKKTLEDLLAHIEADTEIITVLDGVKADPFPEIDERVTVLWYPESIGQRAATNAAARIARGEYLIKCDAHCAFDQGFDRKLLEVMQPTWTQVPVMRNLHAFDWRCRDCDWKKYQGPTPLVCEQCGGPHVYRDIVWIAKTNPQSKSYCFDPEPHFQYFGEFTKRPEYQGLLTETMSLQGSFFMVSRQKYFELDLCDETWGSWGSQGIEVACKTWLSGGRCIVNHDTWYAHMFRTQGGDFSFPYHLSGRQVEHAKRTARKTFFESKWPLQVHSLSWLVEKFWPVPGWTEADLARLKASEPTTRVPTVGIEPSPAHSVSHVIPSRYQPKIGMLYYTDNCLDPLIAHAVTGQLDKCRAGKCLISSTLVPSQVGEVNVLLPLQRGYLTMFQQILAGLEALDGYDYVFFCEHDVLYHPSHFDFRPPRDDVYYYNTNCWKVRFPDGHALKYLCKQTSQLCANRTLLIHHYEERVRRTEAKFSQLGDTREFRNWIRAQGFEPGSHGRAERVDDFKSETWESPVPNIDIRHQGNLTSSRWSKDQFRDQRNCQDWQEAEGIKGWYKPGDFEKLIRQLGED